MKKVLCTIITIVFIFALAACEAGTTQSTPAYPIGMDSGYCEGIGGYAWGTDKATVSANTSFRLSKTGNAVLDNAEFAGIPGELSLRFSNDEDTLVAGIFTFQPANPIDSYKTIFNTLVLAYGNDVGTATMWSSDGTVQAAPTVDELKENGNSGAVSLWYEIPAGDENTASVMLTLSANGIIMLHFMLDL